MRHYRFLQLDVFTNQLFGGNQLAVFTSGANLTDGEMQAIAREMNFAETTFILPASDAKALCRVRIFTPAAELPLAGHPVVGTTFALAHDGKIHDVDPSPVYLQLGVGTLPVDVLFEGRRLAFVWMHQPLPVFEPWTGDRVRLAAALGLAPEDFAADLPIERGSAGVPFVYIPLRSLEALGRAVPGADLSAALQDRSPQVGAYLFSTERPTSAGGADIRVRMFAPGMGIAEDAATGSAAGPFGVYLLRQGRVHPDDVGEARVRVEQGVEMGRPSQLDVAVATDTGTPTDVRVGGEAVVVGEGELWLP